MSSQTTNDMLNWSFESNRWNGCKMKIQAKSTNWMLNKNFEFKQRTMCQIEYHNHSTHFTDTVTINQMSGWV